jgi:hypothetical protein
MQLGDILATQAGHENSRPTLSSRTARSIQNFTVAWKIAFGNFSTGKNVSPATILIVLPVGYIGS